MGERTAGVIDSFSCIAPCGNLCYDAIVLTKASPSEVSLGASRSMGRVGVAALALAVFVLDFVTPVEVSVSVLYVLVVILAA